MPQGLPEYDVLKGRGIIDNKKSFEIAYRVFHAKENQETADNRFKIAIFKDLHKQKLITENQLSILLKKLKTE
jgi:hypothetical protein